MRTGDRIDFVISATNHGPDTATNVIVTSSVPTFVTIQEVTSSTGEAIVTGQSITIQRPDIRPGERLEMRVRVQVSGFVLPLGNRVSAAVTASTPDSLIENNSAMALILPASQ